MNLARCYSRRVSHWAEEADEVRPLFPMTGAQAVSLREQYWTQIHWYLG